MYLIYLIKKCGLKKLRIWEILDFLFPTNKRPCRSIKINMEILYNAYLLFYNTKKFNDDKKSPVDHSTKKFQNEINDGGAIWRGRFCRNIRLLKHPTCLSFLYTCKRVFSTKRQTDFLRVKTEKKLDLAKVYRGNLLYSQSQF